MEGRHQLPFANFHRFYMSKRRKIILLCSGKAFGLFSRPFPPVCRHDCPERQMLANVWGMSTFLNHYPLPVLIQKKLLTIPFTFKNALLILKSFFFCQPISYPFFLILPAPITKHLLQLYHMFFFFQIHKRLLNHFFPS